jgi:pimeloyl-ACP methyl ester carboxylesterase
MSYLWALLIIVVAMVALLLVAVHIGFRAPRNIERSDPGAQGLPFRALRIPTVSGKSLFAWLLPQPASPDTVIILHGWGGNAELMLPLTHPFHRAGLNVLLPDARNHGHSDGDSFSSLPRFAEDLGKAVDWVRSQPALSAGRVVLLGHSIGAGACLLEASRRDDISAVISISAFAHPEWMMRRYLGKPPLPGVLTALILRYVEWVIGHSFGEIAPISTVCQIDCPVLLVHGVEDRTVPVEDMRTIRDHCPRPHLSFLEIEGADHDSVEKIEQHGAQLLAFLQQAGISLDLDHTTV